MQGFQEAFDFLEEERVRRNVFVDAMVSAGNARRARRVAFTTIFDTPETFVTGVFITPTGVTHLHRQNAMIPRHFTFLNHVQDFFLDAVVAPPDFECGICLETTVKNVVCFPNKCHNFHRACLNRWMNQTQTCPMCRSKYNLWFI